jgi:DNA-binding response OmpR family regulator
MKRKTKILIVDDDVYIVKALKDHLVRQGYDIYVASDGEEGVSAIMKIKPDLILLDIIMPKMDGITLLKLLKADALMQDIPVIMITNLESKETLAETHASGIDVYLIKANYCLCEVIEQIEKTLKDK